MRSIESTTNCALVSQWRALATNLRNLELNESARAFEVAARELEQWLAKNDGELLSVADAATIMNRDPSTIGRWIRKKRLANHGTRTRPKVRRGDLVTRANGGERVEEKRSSQYDVESDARCLLARRGGT